MAHPARMGRLARCKHRADLCSVGSVGLPGSERTVGRMELRGVCH